MNEAHCSKVPEEMGIILFDVPIIKQVWLSFYHGMSLVNYEPAKVGPLIACKPDADIGASHLRALFSQAGEQLLTSSLCLN